MRLPRSWAGVLLLLLSVVGRSATATHEPDHRFIVLGFLTDAEGRARAGVPVVVTRVKTGLRHPVRTDANGFYIVVLHLHDEDEGERLTLEVAGATVSLVARFDAKERRLERGTRVDVRDGVATEMRDVFPRTLRDYLER
jgi:hypothetical protein